MKTFQVTQAAAHTAYCGDKRGRGRGWGGGNVTLHLPLGGQGLCRVGGLCSPSLEPRMLRLAEGVPEPTGTRLLPQQGRGTPRRWGTAGWRGPAQSTLPELGVLAQRCPWPMPHEPMTSKGRAPPKPTPKIAPKSCLQRGGLPAGTCFRQVLLRRSPAHCAALLRLCLGHDRAEYLPRDCEAFTGGFAANPDPDQLF